MRDPYNLQRFIDAQEGSYDIALAEIQAGNKRSHWIWFVFPQLAGLGLSPTSQYYAIGSTDEARAYLAHPVLGARLREAVAETLIAGSRGRDAEGIFGALDAMKLRSSLTLFNAVEPGTEFATALDALFGAPDERTLALLNG